MFATEVVLMDTEEKRKYLNEAINKMDKKQIEKLYHLIRGIFGKAI